MEAAKPICQIPGATGRWCPADELICSKFGCGEGRLLKAAMPAVLKHNLDLMSLGFRVDYAGYSAACLMRCAQLHRESSSTNPSSFSALDSGSAHKVQDSLFSGLTVCLR